MFSVPYTMAHWAVHVKFAIASFFRFGILMQEPLLQFFLRILRSLSRSQALILIIALSVARSLASTMLAKVRCLTGSNSSDSGRGYRVGAARGSRCAR
jgi:hypothetical protein